MKNAKDSIDSKNIASNLNNVLYYTRRKISIKVKTL